MKNIDVKKCINCRTGLDTWMRAEDGTLCHFDFFGSYEAATIHKCENESEGIEECLNELPNGLFEPKEEYKEFFKNQNFWWEDIREIVFAIKEADPSSGVMDLFTKTHLENTEDKMLENQLIVLGRKYGIEIDPEIYPDLLTWKPL